MTIFFEKHAIEYHFFWSTAIKTSLIFFLSPICHTPGFAQDIGVKGLHSSFFRLSRIFQISEVPKYDISDNSMEQIELIELIKQNSTEIVMVI